MDKRDSNNAGFSRDGADLAIIILSDENEMSDGREGSTSAQAVVDHTRSLWPLKRLSVHAIVILPGDKACFDTQAAQFSAPRLVDMNEIEMRIGG